MDKFVGYGWSPSSSWQASIILRNRFELTVFKRSWRNPSVEVRLTLHWIGLGVCLVWFGFLVALRSEDFSYG